MPRESGGAILPVDAAAAPSGHVALLADTDASGTYQVQLTGTDGIQHVEQFAFNVLAAEGDLHKLDSTQLAGRLDGLRDQFHQAGDINYNPQQLAGFNPSESLLYGLVPATPHPSKYWPTRASYHPRPPEAAHDGCQSCLLPKRPCTTYELTRLQAFGERWHYLVLAVVASLSRRLPLWMIAATAANCDRSVAFMLLALAADGRWPDCLSSYLHLENEPSGRVVHNSRVPDAGRYQLEHGLARRHGLDLRARFAHAARASRLAASDEGQLVDKLRERHDVDARPLRRRHEPCRFAAELMLCRPRPPPYRLPTASRSIGRSAAAARDRNAVGAGACDN